MLVKVDQLKIGDEILIGAVGDGNLRWMRILKIPMIGKRTHWKTNQPLYKSTLCSVNIQEVQMSNTYNGNIRTWTRKIYQFTGEGHNTDKYINLNEKHIWLIKRQES